MQNLKVVLAGLQSQRKQLERELDGVSRAIKVLTALVGGRLRGGTRTISAAGRARIAAAQRARWAKVRAGKRK